MNENELRIGNLIDYYKQSCHVMGVYSNNKVELGYFTDSVGFIRSLDDVGISPITLTEEILLKCGFEASIELPRDIFVLGLLDGGEYIGIALTKDGDNICLYIDNIIPVYIKYLHQLQNLYFALTGEELSIKEN